ncbi:hypothetical protein GLAREA_00904 [Glarea lozoyensis ATCC 20868]|uniref:LysM domain-containing protein n=1 Tax=Glarea lozoyensis (strain ATCC 20868 / MF5171) TaxID=1116229 RepID=S3CXT7_GLAL2|nr:uncharacterized protein GLAREA_00904 [Glarea lozoyensis ATCC 20868]EPE29744.1 hypothetical protein GLAREA_00904 [Glarea lozoyensis ATCC 20868]
MDSSPNEACATCARYLISIPPTYDEKTEKPIHNNSNRRLDCCGRVICGDCIAENSRFAAYCPFCQISLHPTSLPQGLRDPPAYTPESASKPNKLSTPLHSDDELPSYTPNATPVPSEKQEQPTEDTLHFLNHAHETLPGLALAYSVPLSVLRKANNLHSDHLLQARRSIVIPGEYYKGGSLSPRPVEGEEEERRKGVIRRWMVGCKVSE